MRSIGFHALLSEQKARRSEHGYHCLRNAAFKSLSFLSIDSFGEFDETLDGSCVGWPAKRFAGEFSEQFPGIIAPVFSIVRNPLRKEPLIIGRTRPMLLFHRSAHD